MKTHFLFIILELLISLEPSLLKNIGLLFIIFVLLGWNNKIYFDQKNGDKRENGLENNWKWAYANVGVLKSLESDHSSRRIPLTYFI